MKRIKKNFLLFVRLLLVTAMVLGMISGCGPSTGIPHGGTGQTEEAGVTDTDVLQTEESGPQITEDGQYSSRDEVALYLHTYHHLPSNYITKAEARKLGWDSQKGNLWQVAKGMSIGGDSFGNHEGKLPEEKGLKYFECDIDFDGSYRGAKRIIYSSNWDIYYTEDHYNTFTQLYKGE